MAKEVKIKITADNKNALTALTQIVEVIKKFSGMSGAIGGVSNGVSSASSALNGMGSAATGAADKVKTVGDNLDKMGKAAGSAGDKVKAAGDKGKESFTGAANGASAFGQSLANVTIVANGLFMIIGKIKDVVSSAAMPGIDYTKTMESARLGTAGILISMTNLNGETLGLNDALAITDNTLDNLQQRSTDFNLSVKDTVQAFQAIVAPGIQAKMTLEQIVALSVQGTKAVNAMLAGTPNMGIQLAQELRSMVSGNVNQDSTVARALGITNESIEEAKQSAGGLFAYLTDKMNGFTVLAGEIPKTIAGKSKMLETAFEQVSSKAFEPLVAAGQVAADEILDKLMVVSDGSEKFGGKLAGMKTINPEVVENLRGVAEYLADMLETAKSLGSVLYNGLSPALPILKDIASHTEAIAILFGTWLIGTAIVKGLAAIEAAALPAKLAILYLTAALDSQKAAALAAALGLDAAKAATVGITLATEGATIATDGFKLAIRGLLASTVIGALVVGLGMLAEKWLDVATAADKAKAAQDRKSTEFAKGTEEGSSSDLGYISRKYEGGSMLSYGDNAGDPGGPSYGPYQFTANGTMPQFIKFLQEQGYPAGDFLKYRDADLGGGEIDPNSEEFHARWEAATTNYKESLSKAVDEYARESYYDTLNSNLEQIGTYLSQQSAAVQQAAFSIAIQHGAGRNNGFGGLDIMEEGFNNAGANASQSDILKAIYAARSDKVQRDAYMSDDIKAGILENRYPNELSDLLNEGPDQNMPAAGKDAMAAAKANAATNAAALQAKNDATAKNQRLLDKAQAEYDAAVAAGELEKYMASLEDQKTKAEQQHDVGVLGNADYFNKIREITINTSTATIGKIQADIMAEQKLLGDKATTGPDKINIRGKIVKLQADLDTNKIKLATALDTNIFEQQQQAIKDIDTANNVWINYLTALGATAKSIALKMQNSEMVKSILKLRNNNTNAAADAQEKLNELAVQQAVFADASTQITNNLADLAPMQEASIRDIAQGKIDVVTGIAAGEKDYSAASATQLDTIQKLFNWAKMNGFEPFARTAEAKVKEINVSAQKYFTDLLAAIDTELQRQTDEINNNWQMTTGQKTEAISLANLKAQQTKLEVEKKQREAIVNELGKTQLAAAGVPNVAQQKVIDRDTLALPKLDEAIKKSSQLVDNFTAIRDMTIEVGIQAKQSFENGLLTFLTTGITQSKNLEEAIGNLFKSVLQSIQEVYAKQLTKNIMASIFPVEQKAAGGDLSPGLLRGPGTSTSDSIMAFGSSLGKVFRFSDGEFMMSGKGVKAAGLGVLNAINRGISPAALFTSYAAGGNLTNVGSVVNMAGPQDIATSLTSGDTTLHLNQINVSDPEDIGKYLHTRSGGKNMINWLGKNSGTVRQVLKL